LTAVLGNLVREASLHEFTDAGEFPRVENDDGGVDLVGYSDASP
jgi:hypothetical protein